MLFQAVNAFLANSLSFCPSSVAIISSFVFPLCAFCISIIFVASSLKSVFATIHGKHDI